MFSSNPLESIQLEFLQMACSIFSSAIYRERVEANIRQYQKVEAMGLLAGGIAHDFNNMLGAIKSAHDLLRLDLDEEQYELLEVIDEATDRSANLIKQLRLFSKRNDSEESVIDLLENADLFDNTLIDEHNNFVG